MNARYGETRPKLTLIPFLVQALVRAVADFPQMNALYDDEAEIIHRYGGLHVGIATQIETPARAVNNNDNDDHDDDHDDDHGGHGHGGHDD